VVLFVVLFQPSEVEKVVADPEEFDVSKNIGESQNREEPRDSRASRDSAGAQDFGIADGLGFLGFVLAILALATSFISYHPAGVFLGGGLAAGAAIVSGSALVVARVERRPVGLALFALLITAAAIGVYIWQLHNLLELDAMRKAIRA
jgi:hypothetical protein